MNDEPHADAKVAAVHTSAAALGDRLLIARPGLIVGSGDPSDRFGSGLARLSRSGPSLIPTTEGRFGQVVDVEGLAAWIVGAGHEQATGVINAVGEVHEMQDFLDAG